MDFFLEKNRRACLFTRELRVVNAVNFQVNFRNLHHSLQGLKLSCLQLIFEEDVNIDLDLI